MANCCDNFIKISFDEEIGLTQEEKKNLLSDIRQRLNGMKEFIIGFLGTNFEDINSLDYDFAVGFFGATRFYEFDILEDEGYIDLYVVTDWSPLNRFGENLTRLYPQFKFENVYYEPGIGFAGKVEIMNGEYIEKTEYTHYGSQIDYFKFLLKNELESVEFLDYLLDENEQELYEYLKEYARNFL